MRIPKNFKLLGQIITVKLEEQVFIDHEQDLSGLARYRTNEIFLRPSGSGTEEQLEQVFCHELVHFVLYFSGGSHKGDKDYMHQEEDFVDLTAHLLHQALNTFEGDVHDPVK